MMKPLTNFVMETQRSEHGDLLWIRLVATPEKDVTPEVAAQLGPGDKPINALCGLRDDLTVALQTNLIAMARDILNQMETSLRGGVDAKRGQKPVKA